MTVGCPSNGRRASSISALPAPAAQTSAGGTACSLLPAAGCAAAQASPPHRTPIAGLAIPLLTHTCCYSPATVDGPVNPRTVVLPSAWETTAESSLPPCCSFRGPAVVHHPGALGAAWSTWSMTDMLTARSTAAARKCLLITRKIIIPPPDSGDPQDGPPYFTKKTFPPDCWDPPATSSHARKCVRAKKRFAP